MTAEMNHDRTVFVVDDEPAVRKALSRLLAAGGYNARLFASAREFMQYYKPGSPGCLLVDFSMPEITGLDLQRWLASSGDTLPVVFLTCLDEIPAPIREIMMDVAFDVFSKPCPATALFGCLEKALTTPREALKKPGTAPPLPPSL